MYSDEECEDCMNYDVIYEKNNLKLFALNNYDEELLIEYAPKLFNTYNGQNLKEVMIDTAVLIHNYKSNFFGNAINSMVMYGYPLVMKKETEKKRQKSFKTKVEDIIKLLGGDVAGTKKGNELKQLLEDALENTQDYFIPKLKMIEPKTVIENYLVELKLEGKSLIIKDFIKAIK